MDLERTFNAMLETHGRTLRRIARTHAASRGEEEDLEQEILLRVWRALPSFRGESALGTWLYRVALNTVMTYHRSAARRPATEGSDAAAEIPAPSDTAQREAGVLHEFMATLPPVDRSVLLLRLEGVGNQVIAEVLGVSTGAVGVRLHRLKKKFEEPSPRLVRC